MYFSFSNRRIGGKDPSSAVGDLFRGSLVNQSVGQDGSRRLPSWAMLPQPSAA